MKKTVQIIIIISSFLTTFITHAQDKNLITKVLNQLSLNTEDVNLNLIQTKVLPYAKEKTALIIPRYQTNQAEDEFYVYDAFILIVDNKSSQILNKYFESNKWISDAIRLNSLTIDTEPYKLNDNTHAFGVRVSYTGNSRLNPYAETKLSLYIPIKNELKQLANDISIESSIGEWNENCLGESQNQEITIEIDKEKTNGFYNLVLLNKITNTFTTPKNEDCDEKISTSYITKKLKYNGKTYE